jgi:hypothetical protein
MAAAASGILRTMPSRVLQEWTKSRRRALDEIAAAHVAVGGSEPGRRRATEQINHAYAVLLSSQFQGFCRDLHTEAIHHLVARVPPELAVIVRLRFVEQRKLDSGNPNPGNIGSDFKRIGINFWPLVQQMDPRRGSVRQKALEELMVWRNAIAHQDFPTTLGRLRLADVRRWRAACSGLVKTFDLVVGSHVEEVTGTPPW